MERRSPTGIARQRETRPNNAAPDRAAARNPPQRPRRRSAKPAPTTPPPITGTWSAGLRPASRGSAKPAPTTPPTANLTPTNPRIANRAESRGHGAPVSDRHRAGARNPHRRRRAPPISRLRTHASPTAQNHGDMERRSPTGIARERETRTDDAAPRQSHGCEPTHRQPRRITRTWSAGLRPASRGSAKPAPTTLRHASGQSSRWGPARAGLRPAPGPSVSGGFPH